MTKKGRKPGFKHAEETREKIKTAWVIERFQLHLEGQLDLTPTQISVGKILLDKSLPDLKQTERNDTVEHRYVVEVPSQILSEEEWAKRHSPTIQ